jgi:hypothetical protein
MASVLIASLKVYLFQAHKEVPNKFYKKCNLNVVVDYFSWFLKSTVRRGGTNIGVSWRSIFFWSTKKYFFIF